MNEEQLRELEEQLDKIGAKTEDVIDDFKKDTPNFFKRVWTEIKKLKAYIISFTITLILLLTYHFLFNKPNITNKVETIVIEDNKPDDKVQGSLEEKVKANVVMIPTDKAIVIKDNFVVVDLSKMIKKKEVETTNIKNGKQMIGLSYALEYGMEYRDDTSIYLTYYTDK